MESSLRQYSIGEEIANSITHGVGILLAIGALGILSTTASLYGNIWHVTSVSVYAVTLILLYTASTLYHSIQHPRTKHILQIIDHAAIYILIAGTYTPFTLVSLRGPWGWSLFIVIWCLAFIGTAIQFKKTMQWRVISLVLYVGMGWTALVAIKPLISSVATGGIVMIITGGVSYTFGILFYGWKSLKFHHAIWHIFVLTGSILHFFAVLFYVIPIRS
jgi:hemolysin III